MRRSREDEKKNTLEVLIFTFMSGAAKSELPEDIKCAESSHRVGQSPRERVSNRPNEKNKRRAEGLTVYPKNRPD